MNLRGSTYFHIKDLVKMTENKKKVFINNEQIETFEDILDIIGTDGRINFLLFFCAAIGGLVTPLNTFSYEFLGATPHHWCHIEELSLTNWTSEEIRNFSAPSLSDGTILNCYMYDWNYEQFMELSFDEANNLKKEMIKINNETKLCYKRDFDDGVETIVTKWDLVCERRALYSTTQAAVQGGMLLGSLSAGYLMDRFGRLKIYKVSVVLYSVCGIISTFSPTIGFFIVLKVLSAMLGFGFYLAGFVFSLELCSPKQRSSVGNYYVIPWAFGMMLCAGISYAIRPWYYLQVTLTIPSFLLIGNFWILSESPRWLILKGRHEEAYTFLRKVAKGNGRTLPDREILLSAMKRIEEQSNLDTVESSSSKNVFLRFLKFLKYLLVLLINPHLRMRTIYVFISFFSVSLVYYGVSLGSVVLSTDPYLYLLIVGALEVPSYLILWPTVLYLGRRKTIIMFFVLSAISTLSVMILLTINEDKDSFPQLKLALFLMGKFAITPAFHLLWVFTAEQFPTNYRSLAVGEANCIARVGSICSPYVNDLLREKKSWSPGAVFGVFSLIGGLVTIPLPETTEFVLPEVINKVETLSEVAMNDSMDHATENGTKLS